MRALHSVLALSLFLISNQMALASSSSETATGAPAESSSTGSGPVLKQYEENHEITDAQLKAQAGSLSVFSARFNLSYYGPPVGDLSALNQPNPDGAVSTTQTAISGSTGFRYRLDSATSLSLFGGVSYQYPFRDQQKFDINNPSLSYDKTFRLGGTQILSSPSITAVTAKTYTKVGEYMGLGYSIGAVYNIGSSGFAVGGDASLGYYFFDRPYVPDSVGRGPTGKPMLIKGDGKVRRSTASLNPGIKYNINKRLNINTTLGFALFNTRYASSEYTFNSRTTNQRLTLGYALTRDIYFSPYIQFYPSKMEMRTTTINMSTTFSIL